jgi:hypothetical protein
MPRSKPVPGWKVVAFASPILAIVFPLFEGWRFGYERRSVIWLAAAGAALGVIAAPMFEPKAFRHPVGWQVFFSVLSCVFIAIQQQAGKAGFAIALVAGVVLGLTAKWWLNALP